MKFDINQFIYVFEEGGLKKLQSITYLYHCNLVYVYENDYALM